MLGQAGSQPGVALTSLLANASQLDNLDDATLPGATVVIETPDDAELARDQGDGLYIIDPRNSELTCHTGEIWTLWAQAGMDVDSAIDITLPGLAPIEVPPEHVAGAPLYIDFTGMGYDHALVMVYDIEGNETWSNAPVTVEEVYAMTHTDVPLTVIEVPGEAFPDSGLYGIGVAGLLDARPDDLYAVNTHLSGGTAGKLKTYPIAA